MRRSILLMILAMALGAAAAPAQDIPPHARLRIRTNQGKTISGTLTSLDDRSVTLAGPDGSGVRRADIQMVEVSRKPSRKGRGAAIGFFVGAAGGALWGVLGSPPPCGPQDAYTLGDPLVPSCGSFISPGVAAAMLGFTLGALGAGIGAGTAHGEIWEPVSLPGQGDSLPRPASGQLHLTVAPSKGRGLRIAASVGF
jgi:hypothetical protein